MTLHVWVIAAALHPLHPIGFCLQVQAPCGLQAQLLRPEQGWFTLDLKSWG